MAFGLLAYYKKELKPSDVSDFREELEIALDEVSFSVRQKNEDRIILKIGRSAWSWGEKMIIDLSERDKVTIVSKCAFPLQCIDYGKNRQNVELLIDKMDKEEVINTQ